MYSCVSVTIKHLYKTFTTMTLTCLNTTSCLTKKKCSLVQNVAAHDRNSYETQLEHGAAHDWCVWLVLKLAVCTRRKQGAPLGSVPSPAQTPERGWGEVRGQRGGHPSLEKQFPKTCKQPKAIQPQESPGQPPVKTIKMSDVLKTYEGWRS